MVRTLTDSGSVIDADLLDATGVDGRQLSPATRPQPIRKRVKRAALTLSKRLGVFAAVRDGRLRDRRLLILCYHGISLEDEHEWNPGLYMSAADFRERMTLLRRGGYRVLSLDEALRLLRENELPSKSVVITFDDGFHDFYECAYPILQEFEYPATVYLTTYYCRYRMPIFNVLCSYLLWRGRGLVADGRGIVGREGQIDARTPAGRDAAFSAIQRFVESNGLCAEEKNQIAATLAERLRVDYDAVLAKRILQLMSPDEVGELSGGRVDIQLHTHRHRTPTDRVSFLREIADNRDHILAMTRSASVPSHFCYPSGVHRPEFLPWLQEAGVVSATICAPGMVSQHSHPLLLPRLLDTAELAPIEFEGWLAGVSAFLPRWPADRGR